VKIQPQWVVTPGKQTTNNGMDSIKNIKIYKTVVLFLFLVPVWSVVCCIK
jgi:hypothetical protein